MMQAMEDPAEAGLLGFEDSIFIKPEHVHITVAMLKLYSDEARHTAKQVRK